jgi:hypothetical protein
MVALPAMKRAGTIPPRQWAAFAVAVGIMLTVLYFEQAPGQKRSLAVQGAVEGQSKSQYDPKVALALTTDIIACRDSGDLDKMRELRSDNEARLKLLDDRTRAGRCKLLENGSEVFVLDASHWRSGWAQIRPKGDYNEWWTVPSLLPGPR